jgi:hypothetical protein
MSIHFVLLMRTYPCRQRSNVAQYGRCMSNNHARSHSAMNIVASTLAQLGCPAADGDAAALWRHALCYFRL